MVIFDWMPGIVNVSIFGTRYFCILTNILELCSGAQLNILKTDPLESCFVDLLVVTGAELRLGLIISHDRGKSFLYTLVQCIMNLEVF